MLASCLPLLKTDISPSWLIFRATPSFDPNKAARVRAPSAAVRLRPVSKIQPIPLTIPLLSMTTAPSSAAALHASCGERSHSWRPTKRREYSASTGERFACLLRMSRSIVSSDDDTTTRSEEHTSELQSLRHLVCRL